MNSEQLQKVGEWPYGPCLNPRYILNKNGNYIRVGCGKCPSCLTHKASHKSFLCSIEETYHTYCMFVTLTYDNNFVPKMKPVVKKVRDFECVSFYNQTERLSKCFESDGFMFTEQCSEYKSGSNFLPLLLSKCGVDGCIPYASVRDLQLFLKRFRKNLTKLSYEKVRYYAVSEYGPIHYRPHYHLLFFFDKEVTLSHFREVLHKSWTYGRIDSSLSRGKCSSYVSAYVNSSCSLPHLYENRPCCPFSLHSQKFGLCVCKDSLEEIYENGYEKFVQRSVRIADKVVEFMPWRSFTHAFYPKCIGYANKSFDSLLYTYTILPKVKQIFGDYSIEKLADMIFNSDIFSDTLPILLHFGVVYYDVNKDDYFYVPETSRSATTISSISSQLYLSKYFLRLCSLSGYTPPELVTKIVDFYKDSDYAALCNQLEIQQSYYDTWHVNRENVDYSLFYDTKSFYGIDVLIRTTSELREALSNDVAYSNYYMKSHCKYGDSVKHKKLNDINKIFNSKL